MKKRAVKFVAIIALAGLLGLSAIAGLGIYFIHRALNANIADGIGYLLPTLGSYTVNDVTYCTPDAQPQKLDLYIPEKQGATFPLVVYVHGGSWVSGSKDVEATAKYMPLLAKTGYVVAAINYRLAPGYTFPAENDDVKCAIRFLRANAGAYHINPAHVGVIGESAGGYLAAFTGVTGNDPAYKTDEYPNEGDAVQAVIDIAGPTDFTATDGSASSKAIARTFLGSASPAEASVTTHVASDDPPFFIIHGHDDSIVPPSQATMLERALSAAGVPATLTLVKNAGHSIDSSANDMQPSIQQLVSAMLLFLKQTLKG